MASSNEANAEAALQKEVDDLEFRLQVARQRLKTAQLDKQDAASLIPRTALPTRLVIHENIFLTARI